MAIQTRREFLTLCVGAGGLGALGLGLGLPVGERAWGPLKGWSKVTERGYALGTQVSVTALHLRKSVARKAARLALDEIVAVDRLMSIYDAESEVSRLNRAGQLKDPHPYLVEVVSAAQEFARQTNGAFDITVQPLWEAYVLAQKEGRLPFSSELDRALEKVGWASLEVDKKQIRFTRGGMAITLNGIAQGYAADRAMRVLRSNGVAHALVNSGEVGSLGANVDDQRARPWRVGIQHPRVANAFIELVELEGGCLSTSGDYVSTFSPDRLHHHLFDPSTGRSPDAFASVSVLAPTGLEADALSTSLFVLGADAGLRLIGSRAGAHALLVGKNGTVSTSSGFPAQG